MPRSTLMELVSARTRATIFALVGREEKKTILKNIRLLQIGGKYGRWMDSITLRYVQNYKASQLKATDVTCIMEIQQPNTSVDEYVSSNSRSVQTSRSSFSAQIMASMSVNAQVEFISRTQTVTVSSSTDQEFLKTTEQELTNERSTRLQVPLDAVGIFVAPHDVYFDPAGGENPFWFMPKGEGVWVWQKLEDDQFSTPLVVDLTCHLDDSHPKLRAKRTIRWNKEVYQN